MRNFSRCQSPPRPDNTRSLPAKSTLLSRSEHKARQGPRALRQTPTNSPKPSYAGPRYVDARPYPLVAGICSLRRNHRRRHSRTRAIDQQIARIVVHAQAPQILWAEADARQCWNISRRHPCARRPNRSNAHRHGGASRKSFFSKQAIKRPRTRQPASRRNRGTSCTCLARPPSAAADIILRELARRDPALAALVPELLAQVAARPNSRAPMDRPHGCPQCVERICAGTNPDTAANRHRTSGASRSARGEMLLERCHQHATSRGFNSRGS